MAWPLVLRSTMERRVETICRLHRDHVAELRQQIVRLRIERDVARHIGRPYVEDSFLLSLYNDRPMKDSALTYGEWLLKYSEHHPEAVTTQTETTHSG